MVTKRRKLGAITILKGWSANCMLIFYIPLLCSFHVYCTAKDSLQYGEWIKDNGETLVSAGGEFELGFFTPNGSSGHKRYVGIWYTRDKQTVVWVANRDDPVINATGAFGFVNESNFLELQVWDTSIENTYWSAGYLGSLSMGFMNLTDFGNLVVYREDKQTPVWESFKNPTDTFLPGMSMDSNLILTSWRDRDDPGSGNFTVKVDVVEDDKKTLIIKKEGVIYWKNVDYGQLPLSNGMYFSALSGDFDYARLVMHFSGKLEFWYQSDTETELMQSEPSNNCSLYNFCGKFGSCNPNNKLACKCLPGFRPNVPHKWHSGDFSDGCIRNSVFCGDNDTFLSLKMMVVGENPNQYSVENNEMDCRKMCLTNCDCKSYSYESYEQGKCWIWKQDLVILQEEHPDGNNLFVRVAISDIGTVLTVPFYFNLLEYLLSF
uniref:Apple domain-containing protein n=1 Tax=Fagus sylvatica TaxID=28930 RepID=A0A2N9GID3_FAGSY